ncbi:hypothetical protein RN001_006609 [Aquatica leii]|uniref:Peptidase S1 domain-containing protein n=1 Tax=Aquatica leii TaxID=1421715 RepID=A0AAN7SSA2_9COLE|nr:hypothetical protein RN001_006609 [Aquatica leii]
MMLLYYVASVVFLLTSINGQVRSPCPDLFDYVSQTPGQWNGNITLRSDVELDGIWVRLIFDNVAKNVSTEGSFGEIISRGEFEYLLKNKNFILTAGETVKVPISLKYDGDKAPNLIGFRLNGRTVCPEHDWSYISSERSDVDADELFLGDLNSKSFLSSHTKPKSVANCGLISKELSNNDTKDLHPWNVGILLKRVLNKKRICSGTLISLTHVLTAAHCVTLKNSKIHLHPDALEIHLGEYVTKDLQKARALSVIVHPGYNAQNLNNDIAVIKLQQNVLMTDNVRPICLWDDMSQVQAFKHDGTVSGLTFSSNGHYTDRFTNAQLKEVPLDACSDAEPELVTFLSRHSICMVYIKGNDLCLGESGSGVSYLKQGSVSVWQLRGLVIVGVGLQNKQLCNESTFIVIADLTKYAKWIYAVIN